MIWYDRYNDDFKELYQVNARRSDNFRNYVMQSVLS